MRERWIAGSFILAAGLILFFNLWGRSLENHDYVRHAEVAREMIRSGEWVVPHLNGEVYIDKPPFVFWLVALPSSLYGQVTPFLARLPSALSAWIGVIILFLWGKRVYGTTSSGLVAGGVLLSCYQYFSQARLAKTDMVLCLLIILSLYLFYLGYTGAKKKRYLFYGLSFFFTGLAVLTKGPFGLIGFFIFSLFLIKEGGERWWKRWISREFLLGYTVLALTVLPWVIFFVGRVGLQESVSLVRENTILSRHAPFYFYFMEIWGHFAPWSIILPFLFVHLWRRRAEVLKSEESFFVIWFVALFIVLTLFKYRTSRYLLPALPPLALMIGGMGRGKFKIYLIVFLLAVFSWHVREFFWIKNDLSYSPGKVLTEELQPFIKGAKLFGFRLDIATKEEINFYLDPLSPIPMVGKYGRLSEGFEKEGRALALMPKRAYESLRAPEDPSVVVVHRFRYKKDELVLVSRSP